MALAPANDFDGIQQRLELASREEATIHLTRLAEIDPARTLDLLLDPQYSQFRRIGLAVLAHIWVSSNPTEALESILRIESAPDRREVEFRVLHAFATAIPEVAFSILRNQPDLDRTLDTWNTLNPYNVVFSNWAKTDIEGALHAYSLLEDPRLRRIATKGLVRGRGRQVDGDPYAAVFQWAEEVFEGNDRTVALATVVGDAFRNQPAEAMEILEDLADPEMIGRLLSANEKYWTFAKPERLMPLLLQQENLSGVMYLQAIDRYVQILSAKRPSEALRIVQAFLPEDVQNRPGIAAAFKEGFARVDLSETFDWFVQNNDNLTFPLVREAMHSFARKFPQRTADFIVENYPPGMREEHLEHVIKVWAKTGSNEPELWIRDTLDGHPEFQRRLNDTLVRVSGKKKPRQLHRHHCSKPLFEQQRANCKNCGESSGGRKPRKSGALDIDYRGYRAGRNFD